VEGEARPERVALSPRVIDVFGPESRRREWSFPAGGEEHGRRHCRREDAASQTARDASQSARDASQSARDASQAARDDSDEHALTSERWATETSSTVVDVDSGVDSGEYAAKEYAQGTQSGTGGSAKDWAQKTAAAVVSGLYAAKEWAIGTVTRGTAGGGSAKDWATLTGQTVDDAKYGAAEYARGDVESHGGSSKAWAIDASSPDASGEKSAKTLAGEADSSASDAQSAQTASENARDASQSARDDSQSARDASQLARDASQSARDTAKSHRDDAEGFKDDAQAAAATAIQGFQAGPNPPDPIERQQCQVNGGDALNDADNEAFRVAQYSFWVDTRVRPYAMRIRWDAGWVSVGSQ